MPFHPHARRILRSRVFRVAAAIFIVWTFLETLHIHRGLIEADQQPEHPANTEKIFLAALPWNNEYVLRTHLINQIRDLVLALGVGNVYISIYENGSYDGTKDALRDLHRELDDMGVRCRVILDDLSHADIVNARPKEPTEGWMQINQAGYEHVGVHKGDYALRRIFYLAGLRNKVLEPLEEMSKNGETFDKIIFLNDVTHTASDILTLLNTRGGDYAAACSLDFELPPAFYDTFALRDSDGDPAIMHTWPFFRSAASRHAIVAGQPTPVQSCWNGIVAMKATPFYSEFRGQALRFRGVSDSLALEHIEGSECCLIHYDNPISKDLGVWINPAVRVGYCHPGLHKAKFAYDWDLFKRVCSWAYEGVHPGPGQSWVSYWRIMRGLWENRARRVITVRWLRNWKVEHRVRAWLARDEDHVEVGRSCLVDEMQVIEPHGWLHA